MFMGFFGDLADPDSLFISPLFEENLDAYEAVVEAEQDVASVKGEGYVITDTIRGVLFFPANMVEMIGPDGVNAYTDLVASAIAMARVSGEDVSDMATEFGEIFTHTRF